MQDSEFPTGKLDEGPRPVIPLPVPGAFELDLSSKRARRFLYAHRPPKGERCGQPAALSNDDET
ncbi:hypothetical protein D9600_13435 [Deinococcus sp. DB0503]|nr:hypothetical protein [Deinococcus sp. DB0503]